MLTDISGKMLSLTSILGNKKKAAWNLYLFVKEPTEKTMYIWISKNCSVLL